MKINRLYLAKKHFLSDSGKKLLILALACILCLSGCGKKSPVGSQPDTAITSTVDKEAASADNQTATAEGQKNEEKGFTRETENGAIKLSDEVQYLEKMREISGSEYSIKLSYDNKTDGSNRIDEQTLVLTIQDGEHIYKVSAGSFAFYNIENKTGDELTYLADAGGTLVTFRYTEICDEKGKKTSTKGRFDMFLCYGSGRAADEITWYDETLGKNDFLFNCLKIDSAKPYEIK